MESNERDNADKISDILAIVKTIALFASAAIIYAKLSIPIYNISSSSGSFISSYLILFSVMAVAIVMNFFSIANNKGKGKNARTIIRILETATFLFLFTAILKVTDTNVFQYKLLFLFIIITLTIEGGIRYGIAVSVLASGIILFIDLQQGADMGINLYLENDLIIAGVFMVTALVLGYYVKIEEEKLATREEQVRTLFEELREKDSQRAYIEELLINNDTCYKNLIEESKNIIFIHRDGKFIFANNITMELLGVSGLEDLFEKSILQLFPEGQVEKVRDNMRVLLDKEVTEVKEMDRVIIKISGEKLIVEGRSTYFLYEGKPTILTIYRDVTYKMKVKTLQKAVEENSKLLKESRDLNNTIVEYFSNMSHEFKTPLNIISSASQILSMFCDRSDKHYQKNKQYLASIRQNCYRLTRLVNNILEVTKMDKGAVKLNLHIHNIVTVVEEIMTSVISYVESKGLHIIFDTDVEEKYIRCDIEKIETVILNLLSNAIKFSEKGDTIWVTVSDCQEKVCISVKDTGIGIPEDKVNLIFERFGQVDKTFRRNNEGTGIGLALVKSYVELHDGTIRVISRLNAGSEFIIEFPAEESGELCEEEFTYQANVDMINREFSDIQ
ncbi:MAG: ATP-binding protein [Clostridiaceae bacterium]